MGLLARCGQRRRAAVWGGRAARWFVQARAQSSAVLAWGAFVGRFAAAGAGGQPAGLEPHACAAPTPLQPHLVFGAAPEAEIRVQAVGAGVRHALIAAKVAARGGAAGPRTLLAGLGLNRCGQLGRARAGASADASVVTELDADVVQIACGREHTAMVVRRPGAGARVAVCGSSAFGQTGPAEQQPAAGALAPPSTELRDLDVLDAALGAGESPAKVQCGLDHTVVLTTAGRVFALGWGADGQLGAGSESDSARPVRVRGLPDTVPIVDISSSTDFTLALGADGRLFYWGNAEYGQCMVGRKIERVLVPMEVPFGGGRIRAIAAGGCHALVLAEDGRVHACGFGALGLGAGRMSALLPLPISGLGGIDAVWASTDRCLAVDRRRGRVYSWGLGNAEGRLGDGSVAQCVLSPRQLDIDPALARRGLVALGNDIALVAEAPAAPGGT
ncbi:hypothetical protein H4R18_002234 [Coemansia javaensis]|uniref:RCC1-like domain-containing protein n=1 Tax=Coemansia javaensis TaxID=2761396 RepID=A0A9W8HCF6_9FUNG|nr:hypothetical protein H4R18_002234 [Coemansia javaensis]